MKGRNKRGKQTTAAREQKKRQKKRSNDAAWKHNDDFTEAAQRVQANVDSSSRKRAGEHENDQFWKHDNAPPKRHRGLRYAYTHSDLGELDFAYVSSMLSPTEVLLDTACTRSMGGQKAAEAYSQAVLEKAGIPTHTVAGRPRPYHVGGGKTVYTKSKQALPTRQSPDSPVSIAFETGDFGNQPLLRGSEDPSLPLAHMR